MVGRGLLILFVFQFSFCAGASNSSLPNEMPKIPKGFHTIAEQENIPVKILFALALNESQVRTNYGRVIAWSYTLNHKNRGYHFRTHKELKRKVEDIISQGYRLFDVGIAQVNYRWHKDGFSSLDEMINPVSNLTYAAKYLRGFYDKHGDWWVAVGKYHAPNNKPNAAKYTKKVKNIWLTL